MKLHILTLTWNGSEKLSKLTPSLNPAIDECINRNQIQDVCWNVRDNGSKDKDDTIKEIEKFKYDFSIVHMKHNRDSFSEGVNDLFNRSEATDDDFILLLNNDVIIKDPKSLSMMFDLQKKTSADVVGCRLLYTDTNKLQHAGVIFGPRYGNMPYHFRHKEESDKNAEKDRYFQAVTAACCLVKVSAFKRVGLLSESYKWSFEDIDLNLAIGATGGKIAYCGSTTIYHAESATLKVNPVNTLYLQHNVDTFKKKWFGKYKLDHELYLKNSKYNEIT